MERNTRQRTAIREALAQERCPLLPLEVLQAAQLRAPGLSLATVYRNLNALVQVGELVPVSLLGESPRFEMARQHHHHHFKCERCLRVFDAHACPGDLRHLMPADFQVLRHDLTLYGLCAQLRHGRARRAPVECRTRTAGARAPSAATGCSPERERLGCRVGTLFPDVLTAWGVGAETYSRLVDHKLSVLSRAFLAARGARRPHMAVPPGHSFSAVSPSGLPS